MSEREAGTRSQSLVGHSKEFGVNLQWEVSIYNKALHKVVKC